MCFPGCVVGATMIIIWNYQNSPLQSANLRLMATSPHTNLHSVTTFYPTHTKPLPIFTVKIPHFKTKHQFQIISNNKKFKRVSFPITNSAFTDSGVPNNESNDNIIKFFDYFQDLVAFIWQVFPGGSWWNLRNGQEAENPTANPITVWIALSRMWNLIGRDKWIVLVAVASLIVAAVRLLLLLFLFLNLIILSLFYLLLRRTDCVILILNHLAVCLHHNWNVE